MPVFVMRPEKHGSALPPKRREIAPSDCRTENLRLQIAWWIEENAIGAGLDAEMTSSGLAKGWVAPFRRSDCVSDMIVYQAPGLAASKSRLPDPGALLTRQCCS
jgi:hypothetical protein